MEIKYPNITVELTGKDGNAFNLIGLVKKEMRKAKLTTEQIDEFTMEAMSGDYNNLLTTCMKYVEVK